MADDLNKGNTMHIKIDTTKLLNLLGENGEHWVQGKWGDDTAMCLHGAIRRCQPQRGDAYLIEQVARLQGWGTNWNDNNNTDWAQVRRLIVSGLEVTDADLADTFGPQWEQIVALVRRAAVLTTDELKRLSAARATAQDDAQDDAQDASQYIARRAARYNAWYTAWAAACGAAQDHAQYDAQYDDWYDGWYNAQDAVRAAARGLVIRDLIGQRGFTQQHYDLLTQPWSKVIGPVHPDDKQADRG